MHNVHLYFYIHFIYNVHVREQDDGGCEEVVFQTEGGGVLSAGYGPQVPGPRRLPPGSPRNTDEDE